MRLLLILTFAFVMKSCGNPQTDQATAKDSDFVDPTYELILASEITFDDLNPARGDKSPKAGTVWGDRNGTEATGFLLKPSDGFESPPHIHNVSYRGLVISGFIHNDDPDAENMWMPATSFWTQPKGEVHITAAKGSNTMAYIEIEEGPYLVHPATDAFHTDERPVNVDNSNIVWLDASDIEWIEQSAGPADSNADAKVAFLWADTKSSKFTGRLIKLPAGFKGKILYSGISFRAIVIAGNVSYQTSIQGAVTHLEPGSYFSSTGTSEHIVSSEAGKESIIYVRSAGKFEIVSGESEQ